MNILDKIREVDITHTETAAVVGCKSDLHLELKKLNKSRSFSSSNLVVDIEPLRMMVNFISLQCHPGHESKSLIEVFEEEFFVNSISVFDHGPSCNISLYYNQNF